MTIDTVSLTDIGTSLVAIETEVAANQASIRYHQAEIGKLYDKNEALSELAKTLIKSALPLTLNVGTRKQVLP